MKAKELMDKEFVYLNCEDSVVEVSKVMEEIRRFTCPVVNDNKQLVGWVTSFDITRGLREGNEKINEIMSSYEEITTIHEDAPARLAVILTANNKFVTVPVINDENQVIGMIRACDIVELLSELYDIKVSKLYKAMQNQLKGVTWEELMAASALVSKKTTGKKISPEEYEASIMNSTFGEAIWATGGLEKFFAGLISVGELVIARKVGRARK
ncbi:MAG: CBS domain-containing protein [Methanobrevibacter sp.]|uniref:CBS domain-containing protein n=1 Tax=Methanobrevibacter millerae TaxID=230361 RepID=A0A8T3VB91_9EURY|nr:CBS domain-containing protein [Methanobrevibacter millerae]MBE6504412.1 CBS domain-containing protein [Methanobrevibacter millerae]MBQ6345573.1 CBS domain-containing protein [Methanobrevibacter sp.]MBR0059396.1 CBS domain-containing protein [Methanobrevibacter sp.]MBR0370087.1 CBS domain-containing protein [Methanobrevibacter sp.]